MRLWGPLWTHSAFGFESMNGHLTSMIHSKYRIADQVLFAIDVSIDTVNSMDVKRFRLLEKLRMQSLQRMKRPGIRFPYTH